MQTKGITASLLQRLGPQEQKAPATVLASGEFQADKKNFNCTLNQNRRGRCIMITEEIEGRRDTVIIPVAGLEDLRAILSQMSDRLKELPEFSSV